MDPRFLEYYDRELQYLRELGGEFAQEFPKIAGHLGLDAFECADPYVERLLEGFAFLAARIQLKIDAEFPRFTEHLLEMVCPHYLSPMPSMAVFHFEPNPRLTVLNEGFMIPRGTSLRTNVGGSQPAQCRYETGHDVTLWPIEVTSLRHSTYTGDLGEIRLESRKTVKSTLRIGLKTFNNTPVSLLSLDRLPIFIRGKDTASLRLYELCHSGAVGVMVKTPDGSVRELCPGQSVGPLGFDDDQALLRLGPRSFQGYRLLQEYFALPSRYLFVELQNLAKGLKRCQGSEVEIIVLLDRHDAVVEPAASPAQIALFCTPGINLFEQPTDRIHLSNREHEYHVVPDRTRPLDLEVYAITGVEGHGSSVKARREFRPFYACTDRVDGDADAGYYSVHRKPRLLSSKQQRNGPRSSYQGSEVFLALVDGQEGPYRSDLRQLSVTTLCTNRDLPLAIPVGEGPSDFQLEAGAPVASIRCVAGPSAPRPAQTFGKTSWKLISHLSLNYLSLTNSPDGQGAAALRELLQLYGDVTEPSVRRQISGLRSIASSPIVRRLPIDGPASFGRGLEVTLECDETAFEGSSVFLLGAVLEQFFTKYVAINSFTETVLKTVQRGEVMRWAPNVGKRHIA